MPDVDVGALPEEAGPQARRPPKVPGLDAVTRICVQELAGRADVRDQRGGQQRRIAEVEAPAGAIEECPAAIVRV